MPHIMHFEKSRKSQTKVGVDKLQHFRNFIITPGPHST